MDDQRTNEIWPELNNGLSHPGLQGKNLELKALAELQETVKTIHRTTHPERHVGKPDYDNGQTGNEIENQGLTANRNRYYHVVDMRENHTEWKETKGRRLSSLLVRCFGWLLM